MSDALMPPYSREEHAGHNSGRVVLVQALGSCQVAALGLVGSTELHDENPEQATEFSRRTGRDPA